MWNQPCSGTACGLHPHTLLGTGLVLVTCCVYFWKRYKRSRSCAVLPQSTATTTKAGKRPTIFFSTTPAPIAKSQSITRDTVESILSVGDSARNSVRFLLGESSKTKCTDPCCCCCVSCTHVCCPGVNKYPGSYSPEYLTLCPRSRWQRLKDSICSLGQSVRCSFSHLWNKPSEENCGPCRRSCLKSTSRVPCACPCPKKEVSENTLYEISIKNGVMSAPNKTKVKCA
ncbi:hypothetical protein PoB_001289600 [Plakobranchus ocellatus]|uniref:Uncharacterized protein n=1 Tax=Plakobranchus ocellatus TaxID=259542 RepID=A0AAV3YGF6_9GAST|nr:hypothetical protein PoB_001289600 [Plakobranchus ocellatus]